MPTKSTITATDVDVHVKRLHSQYAGNPFQMSLQGYNIAKLYYDVSNFTSALVNINAYLSVRPQDPKGFALCGRIHLERKDTLQTLENYKKCVTLDPTNKDIVNEATTIACNDECVTDDMKEFWVNLSKSLHRSHVGSDRATVFESWASFKQKLESLLNDNELDAVYSHFLDIHKDRLFANDVDYHCYASEFLQDYILYISDEDKSDSLKFSAFNLMLFHIFSEIELSLSEKRPHSYINKRLKVIDKEMLRFNFNFTKKSPVEAEVFSSIQSEYYYMLCGTVSRLHTTSGEDAPELAVVCAILSLLVPSNRASSSTNASNDQKVWEFKNARRQSILVRYVKREMRQKSADWLTYLSSRWATASGKKRLYDLAIGIDKQSYKTSFLIHDSNWECLDIGHLKLDNVVEHDKVFIDQTYDNLDIMCWLHEPYRQAPNEIGHQPLLRYILHPSLPNVRLLSTENSCGSWNMSVAWLQIELFVEACSYISRKQYQIEKLPLSLQLVTGSQRLLWKSVCRFLNPADSHPRKGDSNNGNFRINAMTLLSSLHVDNLDPLLLVHLSGKFVSLSSLDPNTKLQSEYSNIAINLFKSSINKLTRLASSLVPISLGNGLLSVNQPIDSETAQQLLESQRLAFAEMLYDIGDEECAINVLDESRSENADRLKSKLLLSLNANKTSGFEYRDNSIQAEGFYTSNIDEITSFNAVAGLPHHHGLDRLSSSINNENYADINHATVQNAVMIEINEKLSQLKLDLQSTIKTNQSSINERLIVLETEVKCMRELVSSQLQRPIVINFQGPPVGIDGAPSAVSSASIQPPTPLYPTDGAPAVVQSASVQPHSPLYPTYTTSARSQVSSVSPVVQKSSSLQTSPWSGTNVNNQPFALNNSPLFPLSSSTLLTSTAITPQISSSSGIYSHQMAKNSLFKSTPQPVVASSTITMFGSPMFPQLSSSFVTMPQTAAKGEPFIAPLSTKGQSPLAGVKLSDTVAPLSVKGQSPFAGVNLSEGSKPKPLFSNFPELSISTRERRRTTSSEKSPGVVSDSYAEEEDTGGYFAPVVQLPKSVDIATGEENEQVVFSERAKLYRFHDEQWKDRGVGIVKILKEKSTKKARLVMRRDQVLKLCANHYLTADMELKPHPAAVRSLIWWAQDFSGEESAVEQFAIRFKSDELVSAFKDAFDSCKLYSSISSPKRNGKVIVNLPSGNTWSCPSCLINNDSDDTTCVACHTCKPGTSADSKDIKGEQLSNTFFDRHRKETQAGWQCPTCLVSNTASAVSCVACSTADPAQKTSVISEPSKSTVISPPKFPLFSFGSSTGKSSFGSPGFVFGTDSPNTQANSAIPKPGLFGQPQSQPNVPSSNMLFSGVFGAPKGPGSTTIAPSNKQSPTVFGQPTQEPQINQPAGVFGAFSFTQVAGAAPTVTAGPPTFDLSGDAPPFTFGSLFGGTTTTSNNVLDCSELKNSFAIMENVHDKVQFADEDCPDPYEFDESYYDDNYYYGDVEEDVDDYDSADECDQNQHRSPMHREEGAQAYRQNATSVSAIESPRGDNNDVVFVTEIVPTKEEIKLAESLLLPNTFYLYKRKPPCRGCVGCEYELKSQFCLSNDNDIHYSEESADKPTETTNNTVTEANAGVESVVFSNTQTTSAGFTLNSNFANFSTGIDFASLAASQSDNAFKNDPSKSFKGDLRPIFGTPSRDTEGQDDDDGSNIHFDPVVKLDKVETLSGEEDEIVEFEERAKLYRFVGDQWKERGIGQIKLLLHKTGQRGRVLMRREQILLLCANHIIAKDMSLQPLGSATGKAWVWVARDYADGGEGVVEKLAVRFKFEETAAKFKEIFEYIQNLTCN